MNKLAAILVLVCLASMDVKAQNSLSSIVKKYEKFKSVLAGPRLHFVFNQDKYAAGDTIFFKAYFLKDDMQPVAGRQLIELSLVASKGKIARHFLFAVTNGIGSNQLILPDTLAPGIYLLTAHSSWMKNLGSPPIFTKEITVVGENTIVRTDAIAGLDKMRVSVDPTGARVNITSGDQSLLRYQNMYLIVVNNDVIMFTRSFTQGTRAMVSIDVGAVFLPGMNILYVLDKLGRPVGTGSFFVADTKTINVSVQTIERLQTRKKASLTVSLSDENNRPVQGEFSVKVLNAVLTDSTQKSFEHELASSIPLNESWHQILYGRVGNPRYNFTTDLSKSGTAYMPDGVTPVPAQTRIFFYMQENDVMIQSLTSQGGKIRVSIPDVFGTDNLFYMAEYSSEEVPGVKIVWEDESIQLPAPPSFNESNEPDAYGIFAANKRTIDKAFDFDNVAALLEPDETLHPVSELENRLKGPDIAIAVDDYVSFATMEEMIREIVPALKVHKVKGRSIVQVGLQQGIPESEPLYIIDGIATKDTPFFLSLKPIDLLTVKLMTNPAKLSRLGLMGRSGIVIVDSKSGSMRQPFDPSRFVEGINRTIAFKQPTHKNMRRPDIRSTIYWEPTVKTDRNGKAVVEFECSDDLNAVNVRIDGLTAGGHPFSGTASLNFVLSNN